MGKVGDEDGVVEDDQEILTRLDERRRQVNRMSGTFPLVLDHVTAVERGELLLHELADLRAVLVRDEDEFLRFQRNQS